MTSLAGAEHCCTLRFLPLAVTTMFGADASASSQRNMQLIQLLSVGANMLGLTGQAGGKPAGAGAEAAGGNMLVSLLGMCFGGGQAAAEPGAEPPSTAAGGQVAQSSPAPAAHQVSMLHTNQVWLVTGALHQLPSCSCCLCPCGFLNLHPLQAKA